MAMTLQQRAGLALEKILAAEADATNHATGARNVLKTNATKLAGPYDQDLANKLGLDGSKQQFLDARDLVDKAWTRDQALRDVAKFWGCEVNDLSALEWVISAAHADTIRGRGVQ
jgi:hypothetical protein